MNCIDDRRLESDALAHERVALGDVATNSLIFDWSR